MISQEQAVNSKRQAAGHSVAAGCSLLAARFRSMVTWIGIALLTSGCTVQDWLKTKSNPTGDPAGLDLTSAVAFINNVIDFLGAFGGMVAALLIIAGYQSLMSAGSDEGAQRAKDTIKYSALGMVFMVFGYALVKLIFAVLAGDTNPLER